MIVKKNSVYVYQCPGTFEFFYVGKDKQHGKRAAAWLDHWHAAVGNKIRKLEREGLQPIVNLLLEFDACEGEKKLLSDAETYWIADGRRRSWPLLNCTKGGEGGNGGANKGKPSPLRGVSRPRELVERINAKLRGRSNGPKPGTAEKLRGRVRPDLSFPGSKNPMFNPISNEELLFQGKELLREKGRINQTMWYTFAREKGFLITVQSRFGTFSEFKRRVLS